MPCEMYTGSDRGAIGCGCHEVANGVQAPSGTCDAQAPTGQWGSNGIFLSSPHQHGLPEPRSSAMLRAFCNFTGSADDDVAATEFYRVTTRYPKVSRLTRWRVSHHPPGSFGMIDCWKTALGECQSVPGGEFFLRRRIRGPSSAQCRLGRILIRIMHQEFKST